MQSRSSWNGKRDLSDKHNHRCLHQYGHSEYRNTGCPMVSVLCGHDEVSVVPTTSSVCPWWNRWSYRWLSITEETKSKWFVVALTLYFLFYKKTFHWFVVYCCMLTLSFRIHKLLQVLLGRLWLKKKTFSVKNKTIAWFAKYDWIDVIAGQSK